MDAVSIAVDIGAAETDLNYIAIVPQLTDAIIAPYIIKNIATVTNAVATALLSYGLSSSTKGYKKKLSNLSKLLILYYKYLCTKTATVLIYSTIE